MLCIAGRGFIDGAATAILAQLSVKRGLGTRRVAFADVARARIDAFDAGRARMICIVSPAISGKPPHLRRLVARLRGRMPDGPIVIGPWQADGDDADRAGIDAGCHVSSLRSAVDTALAAAIAGAEPRPGASAVLRVNSGA